MNWIEYVSLMLNILFAGGGLVMIFTLRATRRKANAEAHAEEIENEAKASEVIMEYVVKPLKNEINALRKDVRNLQKAIAKVSDCTHADNCPIRAELQDNQDINAAAQADNLDRDSVGRRSKNRQAD